jgi:hypothetical protein
VERENAVLKQELEAVRAEQAAQRQQNAALEARLAALEGGGGPAGGLPVWVLSAGLPGFGLVVGFGAAWAVGRRGGGR